MKTMKVRFSVTYEATIKAATMDELYDLASDLPIPENRTCRYVPDTFEVVTDADGNPKVFTD